MGRFPDGFDAEGAVVAEVFVIWLNNDDLELTGPRGPAPWMIELDASDHPIETVDRMVREEIGEPMLVHSTSWRHDGEATVILSFVVVVDAGSVRGMDSRPIPRTELARSKPTAPPATVDHEQVMEHALRHLAWLALDDPVVAGGLPGPWQQALADYMPEPFRNLA